MQQLFDKPNISLPRSSMRRAVVVAMAAMMAVLGGCGDIAKLVTPGTRGPSGPAMIAFTANVPRALSVAVDQVTLNVTASYVRQDGTRVRIGSQVLTLTTEALQSVPIPVDIATCLADPLRDVGTAGANSPCAVVLSLALLVNGAVVDEQVVGPLRLTPGATTTVAQPVTLIDLASVSIMQGGTLLLPTDSLRAVLGVGTTVTARVLDTRGQSVTDREVTWSSDAPAVATINETSGAITTVATGVARITARIGALSVTAPLRVARPPAALSINIGAGSGSGTIRSTPAGIDCRVTGAVATGSCTFQFPGDAVVALASTADVGSAFTTWGDACVGTTVGSTCQLTMSQARVATVRFAALRRITVAPSGNGDGRGRVTGAGALDCRLAAATTTGTCAVDVPEGASYTMSAVGEPNATGGTQQFFFGWGGDCVSASGATCSVTPSAANLAVTARFMDVQPIAIAIGGSGGGTVTGGSTVSCVRTGSTNSGICTESATFGTSVTVTALPDAQSTFGGWSGACTGQATTCTTTLTQARNVSAIFTKRQVTLTVVLTGAGQGSVLANGAAICIANGTQPTTTCTQTVDIGSTVTLSGVAGAGSRFNGFTGTCSGTADCVVVMSSAQTIAAAFIPTQFPLTVTITGNGSGAVTSSDGTSCTSSPAQTITTCTRLVTAGAIVRLTAVAGGESSFGGFAGDCSGSSDCTVTMSGPRTVAASFATRQVLLTIRLSGAGSGTISVDGVAACSMALAINGATCTKLVDIGATIAITASPSIESTFEGFSGDCNGAASCTIRPTAAANVSAVFRRRQYALVLSLSGTGVGSVTIDGAPACALTTVGGSSQSCTRLVDAGSSLQFAGAAGEGSAFDGFSGACLGTARCTLVVNSQLSIGAQFTNIQQVLTLTLSGTGSGSVAFPGVAPCVLAAGQGSVTCVRRFNTGSVVQLDASPNSDSFFGGFTGDCVSPPSRIAQCSVTMSTGRTVAGSFTRNPSDTSPTAASATAASATAAPARRSSNGAAGKP